MPSLYDVIRAIRERNEEENRETEARIQGVIKRRASLPADSKTIREDASLWDIPGEFAQGLKRLPYEAGSMALSPIAQVTGSDYLMKKSQELSETAQKNYPSKINPDIPIDELSATELLAYTAGATPQVGASIAAAAIPGGIVSKLAARSGVALARGAKAGSAIRTVGRALAKAAPSLGGATGSIGLEAGSIGQEYFAKEGQIAPTTDVLKSAIPAGLLESISPAQLIRSGRKLLGGKALTVLAKEGQEGLLRTMVQEGGTEWLQNILEEGAQKNLRGMPWLEAQASTLADPEARNRANYAFLAGVGGGAGMHALTTGMDAMRRKISASSPAEAPTQPKEADKPEIEPTAPPVTPPVESTQPTPPVLQPIKRGNILALEKLLVGAGIEPIYHERFIQDSIGKPIGKLSVPEFESAVDNITTTLSTDPEFFKNLNTDYTREFEAALSRARGGNAVVTPLPTQPQGPTMQPSAAPPVQPPAPPAPPAPPRFTHEQEAGYAAAIGDPRALKPKTVSGVMAQAVQSGVDLDAFEWLKTKRPDIGFWIDKALNDITAPTHTVQQPADVPPAAPPVQPPAPPRTLMDSISRVQSKVQAPPVQPMQPAQRPEMAPPAMQQPTRMPLPPTPKAQAPRMEMPPAATVRGVQKPEQFTDFDAALARVTFPDTPAGQAAARNEPDTQKLVRVSESQSGGGSTSLRQEIAERYNALPHETKLRLPWMEWKKAALENRLDEAIKGAQKPRVQPEPSLSQSAQKPAVSVTKTQPEGLKTQEVFPATQREMAEALDRGDIVRHGSQRYQVVQNKQGGWAVKTWDDALPGMVTTTGVVVPGRTPGSGKTEAINKVLQYWHSDNAGPGPEASPPETIKPPKPQPAPTPAPEPEPSGNKIVSDARYAELVKKMKEKLGQLSAGFDPEFFTIGVEMAVYQIESGARKFAEYSKNMVDTFGEKIRPYLKSFYAGARNFPGLNTEGMETDQDIEAQAKEQKPVDTKPPAEDVQKGTKVEPTKEDVGKPGNVNIPALTRALVDVIEENFVPGAKPFDNLKLREATAQLMGVPKSETASSNPKYEHKITQEAFEGALVLWIRKHNPDQETLNRLYAWQPNLNERTGASSANQAYSTPINLVGYVTDALNLKGGETIIEPTAGNGLLVSSVRGDGKGMTLNEIDKTRLDVLKEAFPQATITTSNAVSVPFAPRSVDVVMANPPFGTVSAVQVETSGDKKRTVGLTGLEHTIAWNALEAMKDDGKAVLIFGAEKESGFTGRNQTFNNLLYNQYNVISHFEIPGKLYHRQGADWPIQVIIIKGRKNFQGITEQAPKKVERVISWEQVSEITNDVKGKIDESNPVQQPSVSRPEGVSGNGRTGERPNQDNAGTVREETQDGGPSTTRESQAGRPSEPTVKPERPAGVPDGKRKPAADAAKPGQLVPDQKPEQGASRPGANEAVGPDSNSHVDVAGSDLQAKYEPGSKVGGQGFLTPKFLKNSLEAAIKRLEEREGKSIDEFVGAELGMSQTELKKAFFAPQIDAIGLAISAAKSGAAIVNADQTGVGKGRTAAAMIYWAKKNGMVPVFFTVQANLFSDMYRDMKGIGHPEIKPFIFNSDGVISEKEVLEDGTEKERIVYRPAEAETGEDSEKLMEKIAETGKIPDGFDAVFATYSQISGAENKPKGGRSLASMKRAALNRIQNTFLILDEAHEAGGDVETSTSAAFMTGLLDPSRAKAAYYLSATWAKTPKNMNVYYRAIGGDPKALQNAFDNGGVGMQEMVVSGMSANGRYVRREQDYSTVSFRTNMTPEADAKNEREKTDAFMSSMRLVAEFASDFRELTSGEDPEVDIADLVPDDFEVNADALDWAAADMKASDIFSSLFNLVEQVTASLKADRAADRAIEMVKKGQKPVIAIRNTMEGAVEDLAGEEEFDGTISDLIRLRLKKATSFVVRSMIADDKGKRQKYRIQIPYEKLPAKLKEKFNAAEAEILKRAEILNDLPFAPIDYIRAKLEKNGIRVSEITGRQTYLDYNEKNSKGSPTAKSRKKLTAKMRNQTLRDFNDGRTDALIVNEAGATGLSAHSGKEYSDQRQRSMVIVQPLLDVNDFMQILGRIFRSGAVTDPKLVTGKAPKEQGLPEAYGAPYYEYLQTRSFMEMRPASMQQNKVKSLNAQVSSNQEGHQKIEVVDIYNKYGDRIAREWLDNNPDVAEIIGYADEESRPSADDIVKRLAITTVATQEKFWEEVVPVYKDQIEYLDMMGMNDLVPKSMKDANAKRLSRVEILPAADESSSPVYLEKLEVTIPGKPITYAGSSEGVTQVPAEAISEADKRFEKLIEKIEERNEDRRKEGKDVVVSVPLVRNNAENTKKQFTDANGLFRPGSKIWFVADSAADVTLPAVVKEIRIGEQVNPYAPTNVKVVLNTPGSSGTMVLSMQKLIESGARRNTFSESMLQEEWGKAERAFKTRKGERYFITGDVMRGTGIYTGNAEVVRFSRDNGTNEFGWLLPEGFSPRENTLKLPGDRISQANIKDFINNRRIISDENPIQTQDEKTVKMFSQSGGFVVEVLNTTVGKKITTDDVLARMFGTQGSPWKQLHGKLFAVEPSYAQGPEVLSRIVAILDDNSIGIYGPKTDVDTTKKPEAPSIGRGGAIGLRGGYGPGQALEYYAKRGLEKVFKMAQTFINSGRSFAEFVASAVDRFGARVRVKLAEIWKAARLPGNTRRGAALNPASLLIKEKAKTAQAQSDRKILAKVADRAVEDVKTARQSLKDFKAKIETEKSVTAEVRKALLGYAMRMPMDVRSGFISRIANARTADAGLDIISDMTTAARRGDLRKALRLLRDVSKKAKDGRELRPEFKAVAQKILKKAEEMIDKVKRKGGFDKLIEESAIILSEFVENEMKDGEMAPVHTQAINDLIAGIRKDARKSERMKLDPSIAAAAHARALVNIYRMIERANQIENQIIQGKNIKNIDSITAPATKFIEKNETITQIEGEDSENGFVRRFFDEGMLSFEAIAERLGPAKKLFYDDLNAGHESALGLYNEIMDPLKAMMKKIGMDPDSQKTTAFLDEKVSVAGTKITRGERMEFVCHLLDSSTRREIIKAGAVLRRNQDGDKITITEAQADEIIGSLSANERKIVDAMFSSLGGQLRRAINNTWVFLAGYEKALRNDYFPRSRKGESTGMNAFQRSAVGPMLEGLGIFKERTGSTTKPVIIGDVMTTFHRHVIKAATFAEMAIPIRNVKIAMGHGGIGAAVRKHYGKQFETRIENQVKAMAEMGKFEEGIANQIVSAVTRNIGTHYLGFGISSMLKQFGGLFTMMAEANLGDIIKALLRGGVSPTDAIRGIAGKDLTDETTKLIFKYSPKLRDRYDSHGEKLLSPTFGFQNSLLSASSGKMQDLWRMMKELSMRGLTSFDRQITRVAWMVAEEEATRSGLSKSSGEEFYKAVAKRAEQIVSRTQNSTSVVDMSGIALEARTNALVKAGIAFQSQGNAVYNIARRAVFEFGQGKIGIAGLAYKLAVANVGNALFSALVVSMTRGGGGDEEKKKRRKEVSKIVDLTWEVFNENANAIYFGSMFRPVLMAAKSAVSDQPISQTKIKTENVAQKAVNDSLNSIVSLIKTMAADGSKFKTGKRKGKFKSEEYAKDAADSAINSMAALAGLPRPIVQGGKLVYNLSGGK